MTRILVDPRIAFGRPYVEGSGIMTAVLYSRWRAGEDSWDLSADYDSLSRDDVLAAVDFERWCRHRGRYDAPYAERLTRRLTAPEEGWPRVVWPRKGSA